MDVIEEEAFIKWKEDLSQPYPGKGQALFQVSIMYETPYHISSSCMVKTVHVVKGRQHSAPTGCPS